MAAARSGHVDVARNEFERSLALVQKASRSALTEETMTENASEIVLLEAKIDVKHARELLDQIRASDSAFQNRTVALSYFEAAAEVTLLEGDFDKAERESLAGVAIAEQVAGTLKTAQQRLGWVEQTRDAYLGLTRTYLARNETNRAFAVWERYRSIPFLDTPPSPLISIASQGYDRLDSLPSSTAILDITNSSQPPQGNVVLSFAHFSDGMQTWVFDQSGVSGKWISVPVDVLQRVANRFILECSNPSSSRHALERDARQLYTWLIAPSENLLRHAAVITIEPDTSFESVPFSALIGPDGKYFGDDHSIVVSIDTALRTPPSPKTTLTTHSSALVVGAPASSEPGLAQLPDAESEAVGVAGQFRSVVLAVGADATKSAVIRALTRSQVFHFAGHAVVKNGETCLLLSAGVRTGLGKAESSVLTADDVSRIRLKRCQLAVLSACSTARQDDAMPLSRHGLVSSFLYSGVPQIVASEWDVDSAVTAVLMKRFYADLLTGMTAAQSLRAVTAEIRVNPTTTHPYYWAAFQAFGKP
jgi:CHAT domain-containing protein